MFKSVPFLPGNPLKSPEPLGRYLPPIPDGIVTAWLLGNVQPGSLLLDPFCASPRLAVEAAKAGYRILVTANNPITRFLLEIAANPPRAEDLRHSLSELSSSYKGNERIEPHIRSLYNTRCARCGQIVSADAFIWEHGNPSPTLRIYTCPLCGDTGEHPCTTYDAEQANQFPSGGLHKARALERVVALSDQDRIHVEQALSVYLPRALYALITLINKIEGLEISSPARKHLSGLLLHTFDQASVLWRVPATRERRRQLTIPRHFRENNIWLALEQAVDVFSANSLLDSGQPLQVTEWPEIPSSEAAICIYKGRLVTVADSLRNLNIKAICTAIPRPNQAFWTLSALWAGWLWGREAVEPFKSVLHRQRYDWGWHTTALSSVFKQLVNVLDPGTSILGLIGEAEPGFIAASLVAAGFAGINLEGLALRPEDSQAQIVWRGWNNPDAEPDNRPLDESAISAAKRYLEDRGEPASYICTISSAIIEIANRLSRKKYPPFDMRRRESVDGLKTGETAESIEPTPSVVYSSAYNAAREGLSYRSGFLRYNLMDLSNPEPLAKDQVVQETFFSLDREINTEDHEEGISHAASTPGADQPAEKERPTRSSDISESIIIWLREAGTVNPDPISDRYEQALVTYLTDHPGSTLAQIDMAMCKLFPGLYTPDLDFIRTCLESYGESDLADRDRWHLRPEDSFQERQADITHAKKFINQIGEQLGLVCKETAIDQGRTAVIWIDNGGLLNYLFYPTVSAIIRNVVLNNNQPRGKGFVVLPGSRANLMIYKLSRDPRLSKTFNLSAGSWRFLKFRHLRSLADNPLLNRENIDQLLALDPLTYSTPQLRLI